MAAYVVAGGIHMNFRLLIAAAAALSATGAASACSDSDDMTGETALPADCQAIVDACHHVDVGTGPVHDCHAMAEMGQASSCSSQRSSCVQMCEAAAMDAGIHDGAMMGDAAMMDDHAMMSDAAMMDDHAMTSDAAMTAD